MKRTRHCSRSQNKFRGNRPIFKQEVLENIVEGLECIQCKKELKKGKYKLCSHWETKYWDECLQRKLRSQGKNCITWDIEISDDNLKTIKIIDELLSGKEEDVVDEVNFWIQHQKKWELFCKNCQIPKCSKWVPICSTKGHGLLDLSKNCLLYTSPQNPKTPKPLFWLKLLKVKKRLKWREEEVKKWLESKILG